MKYLRAIGGFIGRIILAIIASVIIILSTVWLVIHVAAWYVNTGGLI